MPTYSYECQSCQHTFDAFQYMSEDALQECPECKKNSLKRLIGAGAGFIFKGSGFYITDYRSKNYTEKAKSESSTTKSTNGSDAKTTSSNTKPTTDSSSKSSSQNSSSK